MPEYDEQMNRLMDDLADSAEAVRDTWKDSGGIAIMQLAKVETTVVKMNKLMAEVKASFQE